jgi:prepilin-type N-terminal cleavage/methylation domain-containing protein
MLKRRAVASHNQAFTLIELLVVVAILGVLAALLIPFAGQLKTSGDAVKTTNRMRRCGVAIHSYAAENQGEIYSLYGTPGTRRWPFLVAPYLQIDSDSGSFVDRNALVYSQKIWRSGDLDGLTTKMTSGQMPVSNLGVFLLNQFFSQYPNGTSVYRWKLNQVDRPSQTPLLAPAAENSGWYLNVGANAPGTKATAAGYTGTVNAQGPTPDAKGNITYLMCDGSIQKKPDFWPFASTDWPAPWKAFHPRGKDAPDDISKSGP